MSHISNITTYYLDGSILPVVSSTSDLGITVESDLSFKLHRSNSISKASQLAGVLIGGFASRRLDIVRKMFITLYTSYIRIQFQCMESYP